MFLVENKDFKKDKGEYLNWIVRANGIKITVLTEKAGVDRSTFYNHIKEPDLPYHIIAKYGEVLHHDFSDAYSKKEQKYTPAVTNVITLSEIEKDRDYWKNKYLNLEAKIRELIN